MSKNTNYYTEIQIKHQCEMKEKRDIIKKRKQRTHRLIVRGAIAENAIEGATTMTDEQFREALYRAMGKTSNSIDDSYSERLMEEITK